MRGTVDRYEVATRHPRTGRRDRWRVRWELPPDPVTGDRRRGTKRGFATKSDAEAHLAELVTSTNNGSWVAPAHERFGAYLIAWLDAIRVKPTTRDNYRTSIVIHTVPRLGGLRLDEVAAEHLDGLYRELEVAGKAAGRCRTSGVTCREHGCNPGRHDGLAPKSVWHVHVALRKALADAVDRGLLARNPADHAHPPRQRDGRPNRAAEKAWTVAQLQSFLTATTTHRLHPLWVLTATTGLRRAEVCGLRWSNVDLDRGRLRVAHTITEVQGRLIEQDDTKTAAGERSMSLDAGTVATLRRWQSTQRAERAHAGPAWTETDLVFTRRTGVGHRPKRLSANFTKQADLAGLPRIGFHGLRHTYATIALRAGVSPEVISKRLGHSSVVITLSLYAHVFEHDDRAAADRVAGHILGR